MNFDQYETEELFSYFSDYYKDVHGIRPRGLANNRQEIIAGIMSLDSYMEYMKSTPEGREQLRQEGWDIDEPEAESEYDDSMDGDAESALASAGWGTDEDYGYYGGTD